MEGLVAEDQDELGLDCLDLFIQVGLARLDVGVARVLVEHLTLDRGGEEDVVEVEPRFLKVRLEGILVPLRVRHLPDDHDPLLGLPAPSARFADTIDRVLIEGAEPAFVVVDIGDHGAIISTEKLGGNICVTGMFTCSNSHLPHMSR